MVRLPSYIAFIILSQISILPHLPVFAQSTDDPYEKIREYETEKDANALLTLLLDLRDQENEPIRERALAALVGLQDRAVVAIIHFFDRLGETSFTGLFIGEHGTSLFEMYEISYKVGEEKKRLPLLFNSDVLFILKSLSPECLLPLFLEAFKSGNPYLPYFILCWSFETGLFRASPEIEEEAFAYLYHPHINHYQCFTSLKEWIDKNSSAQNSFDARSLYYLQKWASEKNMQKIIHMMVFAIRFIDPTIIFGKPFIYKSSPEMLSRIEEVFVQFGPQILEPFINLVIEKEYFKDISLTNDSYMHSPCYQNGFKEASTVAQVISRFPRESQRALLIGLSSKPYPKTFMVLAVFLDFHDDLEILSILVGHIIDGTAASDLAYRALILLNPSGEVLWQLIDERVRKQ